MAAKRKGGKKSGKKSAKPAKAKAAKTTRRKASPAKGKTVRKKTARRAAAKPARARRPAPKAKRAAKARPAPKPKAAAKPKPAPKPKAAAKRKPAPKPKAAAKPKPAPKPKAAAKPTPPAKAVRTRPTRPARPAKAAGFADKLGRFIWFDLMTSDIPGAIAFYGKVFGWTSKTADMGSTPYQMLSAGDVPFGGIVPFGEGNPHWMPYVSVASIDAACSAAERAGGVVCVPPFSVPSVGRFAVVADPLGAVSSPMQMEMPQATDPDAPPGVGLVAWNELVTPEPEKVISFYGKVYGWKVGQQDMGPMGTYYLFKDGDKDLAGMMKTPPNAPPGARPQWLAYVHVTDVDATLAKAVAAGGHVGAPAFDVPGIGRLAIFSDPAGAMIALFKPSAQ